MGSLVESLESRQLFAVSGNGLLATYYNNANFTGTEVGRVDASINFNFGKAGPAATIGGDTFVARWTGKIRPAYSETFVLKTISDDGVRLWVDHKNVIGSWGQNGVAINTATVALEAGRYYDVMLEYREKTGAASIQFLWSSTTQPEVIVPTKRMFAEEADLNDAIDHASVFAGGQLKQAVGDIGRTDRFPGSD